MLALAQKHIPTPSTQTQEYPQHITPFQAIKATKMKAPVDSTQEAASNVDAVGRTEEQKPRRTREASTTTPNGSIQQNEVPPI